MCRTMTKRDQMRAIVSTCLLVCAAVGLAEDFYTNGSGGDILQWDGQTGDLKRKFVVGSHSGMTGPQQGFFGGARKDMYFCCGSSRKLYIFDGVSGHSLKVISSNEFSQPFGFAMGPDGFLYVTNHFGNRVMKFDAGTGSFLGDFVTGGYGGLNDSRGLAFDPQGNLLVGCTWSDSVKIYNSVGTFLGNKYKASGMGEPGFISVEPNGKLYVPDYTAAKTFMFDVASGVFEGVAVDSGSTPADRPSAQDIGANGNLFVVDRQIHQVLEFHPTNGQFISFFASGDGMSVADFGMFGPTANTTTATSTSVKIGAVVGGSPTSMGAADDEYYRIRAATVANNQIPPVRLEIENTLSAVPSEFRYVLESAVNATPVQLKVELFNVHTQTWDVKHQANALTSDYRIQVGRGDSVEDYFDTVTMKVRMRLNWRAPGITTAFPWIVRLDELKFHWRP
ncbi:MAG: hypothetical protein HONBIEJF_02818 [Fimbriimonadaceae bacterium]|nr:hypothetical protein [Fimbriimonadaceae bacterium]